MADDNEAVESVSLLVNLFWGIFTSPINIFLLGVIAFLAYKILKSRKRVSEPAEPEPQLPKLRKDFAVQELKKYDGNGPDGRVLVAVNGKVFDVTKGKRFYGPGGPYSAFGGRDASRGLATFSVDAGKDEYDDLSDLNTMEMDSVREWEEQFREKYEYVGKLLRPGEQPTCYSDEEEEGSQHETSSEGGHKESPGPGKAAADKPKDD